MQYSTRLYCAEFRSVRCRTLARDTSHLETSICEGAYIQNTRSSTPHGLTTVTSQDRWEERKEGFTDKKDRRNAWTETAKNVEAYSERLIRRWNGEIDTLLVYVRLCLLYMSTSNQQKSAKRRDCSLRFSRRSTFKRINSSLPIHPIPFSLHYNKYRHSSAVSQSTLPSSTRRNPPSSRRWTLGPRPNDGRSS